MTTCQPSLRGSDTHDQATAARPGLVIVSNCITPYRVNLHRLLADEIPELKLHTVLTHGVAHFDWRISIPPEINPVNFSAEGENPLDNPLRRPLVEWRKSRRLIQYLRDNRAQAVIFNGYRYLSYLRLMDYCYRHKIPFFVRSDSNIRCERPLSRFEEFCKRKIYAWWIKRASGIMPMGKLGDLFFMKYGGDPNRFYRVPWWPDFDSLATADEDALARFQTKFALRPERRYLLFSGRFVPEKRLDLLIDVFSQIAADRPDWDLLVAGKGSLGDELRRRVPEALRNRVIWTGFLDGQEPALALHAADVLVVPSDYEPAPVVLQEAMAAGLPVVASDVCGAAYEMITDGISGRVFKKGDGNALRNALEDMTQSDRLIGYTERARLAFRQWREKANPVPEVRRALRDVGVLNRVAPVGVGA